MPGADIGPAARDGYHGGARGLFHHRVVDRNRLRRSERVRVKLDEAEIGSARVTASLTACTLVASTLRYSSSNTEARNMKLPLFQK
jgi:hypothetical protein